MSKPWLEKVKWVFLVSFLLNSSLYAGYCSNDSNQACEIADVCYDALNPPNPLPTCVADGGGGDLPPPNDGGGDLPDVATNTPVSGSVTLEEGTSDGKFSVGEVLTVDTSSLSDPDGFGSFNYQWYTGTNETISGATSSSYTLTSDETGKVINVSVSYTDQKGNPEVAKSSSAVTVTAGNSAPKIEGVVPTLTINEDDFRSIDLANITLSDADDDNITLTLAVSSGTIAAVDGNTTVSGVKIDKSSTANMTLSGTVGGVTGYINGDDKIKFITALNSTEDVTLTLTPNDGDLNGTAGTITIKITAVNDDPAITSLPTDITVSEATPSDVNISATTISDVDSAESSISLILSVDTGTLSASDGNSVTSSGSGSKEITLSGTVTKINAFLNNASSIKYTGDSGVSGDDAATLTIKANDKGNTGTGGGTDVTLGSVNIDITDTTPAVLKEEIPVRAKNYDSTPNYTFSTDSKGYFYVKGSCGPENQKIDVTSEGNVTVELKGTSGVALSDGDYSGCKIEFYDEAENKSTLEISDFTFTTPTLEMSLNIDGKIVDWGVIGLNENEYHSKSSYYDVDYTTNVGLTFEMIVMYLLNDKKVSGYTAAHHSLDDINLYNAGFGDKIGSNEFKVKMYQTNVKDFSDLVKWIGDFDWDETEGMVLSKIYNYSLECNTGLVFDETEQTCKKSSTSTTTTETSSLEAVDDEYTTDEDNSITFDLFENDKGDPKEVSSTTLPSNGTLVKNSEGNYTYTPNSNYNGSDSFTYAIKDADNGKEGATVSIKIEAVNDAPIITSTPKNEAQGATEFKYFLTAEDNETKSEDLNWSVTKGTTLPDWLELVKPKSAEYLGDEGFTEGYAYDISLALGSDNTTYVAFKDGGNGQT